MHCRRIVASCHLELKESDEKEENMDPVKLNIIVAKEVKEFFHREGIHSTTIQLEYTPE